MKPVILIALFYLAQLTSTGDERLDRIRLQMARNLMRLPNYTCLMSVDRSDQASARRPIIHVDTLHLAVAEVGGQELVGWPGSKLGEQKLEEMVSGGMIATGDFSSMATIVFRTTGPRFQFVGDKKLNGRPTLQYSFQVDQAVSTYEVSAGPERRAVVGYHGSILVDAESLDLRHLEIIADKIPPLIGTSLLTTEIDYQKVHIGGSDFLLPAKVDRKLSRKDQSRAENVTTLTGCKEYGIESSIRFDAPETPAEAEKPVVRTHLILPEGIRVPIKLESKLDARTTATGDPLVARTTAVITAHDVTIPAGSEVVGRITSLRRTEAGRLALQMEFVEIRAGLITAGFTAFLDYFEKRKGVEHSNALGNPGLLLIDAKQFDISGMSLVYRTLAPDAK